MQTNNQTITLSHPRNLYQVGEILSNLLSSTTNSFPVNPLTGDILGLPGAKSSEPLRRQSNKIKVIEKIPISI